MNNIAKHPFYQDFFVSNHPIALVRISDTELRHFITNPHSRLTRFFFVNRSSRQIREEGRASLFKLLLTMIKYTNFATRIIGKRDANGRVHPYTIEDLAYAAKLSLTSAKKWISRLKAIGYLKITHQIVFDKETMKFSSKPAIKCLTDLFFKDLGIEEKVLRRTIEIAKNVMRKFMMKAQSLNSFVEDEIKNIRKKLFKKPEVKHATEKIPRTAFELLKQSLFKLPKG